MATEVQLQALNDEIKDLGPRIEQAAAAVDIAVDRAFAKQIYNDLVKREERLYATRDKLLEKLPTPHTGGGGFSESSGHYRAFSTRLRRPTHVLCIQFSLFNMPHIRCTLSTMMKDRGLWGTVRRLSPSEVMCNIVCRPENSDAFENLVKWLDNSAKVVQDRVDIGYVPTILISEPRLDSSGSFNFNTYDEAALEMVGTRHVFRSSQHVKAEFLQQGGSTSLDPSDAASSEGTLPAADRYGPM